MENSDYCGAELSPLTMSNWAPQQLLSIHYEAMVTVFYICSENSDLWGRNSLQRLNEDRTLIDNWPIYGTNPF